MTEINQPSEAQLDQAARSISGSLVLTAIRCTLQYIVLPFILPLLGFSGVISLYISLVLESVAIVVILFNIVTLWSTSWRWKYLVMGSVMLFVLIVFLVGDIRALMQLP
ncbi:MAG: hypothetical protein AAF629_04125 [Chloroflexota bacterium]